MQLSELDYYELRFQGRGRSDSQMLEEDNSVV